MLLTSWGTPWDESVPSFSRITGVGWKWTRRMEWNRARNQNSNLLFILNCLLWSVNSYRTCSFDNELANLLTWFNRKRLLLLLLLDQCDVIAYIKTITSQGTNAEFFAINSVACVKEMTDDWILSLFLCSSNEESAMTKHFRNKPETYEQHTRR